MVVVRFRVIILILGLVCLMLGCKQPEKDCDSSSAARPPDCTGTIITPELQLVSPQTTRLSSVSLLVSGVDCGLTPVLAFEISTGADTLFENVDCRADVTLTLDELESDLTYNVRVQASNSDASSKSEYSNTVSFTYDNLPPQITLIGSATINLSAGDAYSELGATAFDSLDQNISSEIEIEQSLTTTDVGIQYVTYSVSDNAGNAATKRRKVVYDYCSVGNRQTRSLDENLFGGSFVVCSFEQLKQVAREFGPLTLTASYKLGKDIDASPTAAPTYNSGKGWDPIGLVSQNGGFAIGSADQIYENGQQKLFEGNFDGSGFEISNLFIRNGIGATGFFAGIGKGLYEPPFPVVKRLKLNNVDIVGGRHTGGLTGWVRYSNIESIHVSGIVSAGSPYSYHNPVHTGGIVGSDSGGSTLKKLQSDVQVIGYSSVGGIAGSVLSNISEVSSSGRVEGTRSVGGIVGHAGTLKLSDSFSDVTVVRSFTLEVCSDYECNIGGLIGVCQYS